MLVRVLECKTTGQYTPAMALAGIAALLPLLETNTAVLDPHLSVIAEFSLSHAQQVETILNWHQGKTMELMNERIESLETKVASLTSTVESMARRLDDTAFTALPCSIGAAVTVVAALGITAGLSVRFCRYPKT
jgi:hypothetical protein